MDDATATFQQLQPRLQGIAYRMLGTVSDAEDVVQDVWLRWHGTDAAGVDNAEAWLVAATTRRAIDRLRSLKAAREQYVGIWLPEPILNDAPATPEQAQAHAGEVSVALLALLERLAPETRAAFLLREVFDADYADIARTLGKSEGTCRQMVHRAKTQLREERARYLVTPEAHRRLMERFAVALAQGDFSAMKSMLSESAELVGDGGGIVTSFPKAMVGGTRIAQLFYAATLRYGAGVRIELASINGCVGVLRFIDGALESAQSFETDGEHIHRIQVQRNPEKLQRIVEALARR